MNRGQKIFLTVGLFYLAVLMYRINMLQQTDSIWRCFLPIVLLGASVFCTIGWFPKFAMPAGLMAAGLAGLILVDMFIPLI